MKNNVVGMGELLWDVFPDKKVLGGAPANFAYHISQFGYQGYAVSAIGKDDLGKEIVSSLEEKKLKSLIQNTDYPTGKVQVTLDAEGVPSYEICENVAWDHIAFTEETKSLAQNTQTVCFGTLAQRSNDSRETIREFIDAMPSNRFVIFDINLRQHFYSREVIEESLQLSNMLKLNEDEVKVMASFYNMSDHADEDVCQYVLKTYHLDVVVLTKGTAGSYVFTPKENSYEPTPKVKVADTVGAGDSFTAAFAASYLRNGNIKEAHRLAVAVSAYVCTQYGAMPKLPEEYLKGFE